MGSWGLPKRPGSSGGYGKKINRKDEAAAKKKAAEEAKIEKTKAKVDKAKETKDKLEGLQTQVENLTKAVPQPQPSYSQPSYAQPAQPSYSQPAPQPQAYHPPQKIGFWERAFDAYKVVDKYQRLNKVIKVADKGGYRRPTRRVMNSAFNYLAEAERYQTKYSNR